MVHKVINPQFWDWKIESLVMMQRFWNLRQLGDEDFGKSVHLQAVSEGLKLEV